MSVCNQFGYYGIMFFAAFQVVIFEVGSLLVLTCDENWAFVVIFEYMF